MLRILTMAMFGFLLMLGNVFATEKLDFFKEEKNQPQANECSECSKWQNNLNTDLKNKLGDIQSKVNDSFTSKERQRNREIILFIDPDCNFSDSAVRTLVKFKTDFPDWQVKGVIVSGLKNLKQRLLQNRSYFNQGIEFSVDLGAKLAREFNIDKTPAYVISYKGRHYKISGQPDLNEIISKLNK